MDGTCIPPDNTDSGPGSFDNVGAPTQAYLSERGY